MPLEANACTSRSRAIEVAEVLDQWFGANYGDWKIRGDDGGSTSCGSMRNGLHGASPCLRVPRPRLSCRRPVRRPLGVNDEPSPSDASVRKPRTECGC